MNDAITRARNVQKDYIKVSGTDLSEMVSDIITDQLRVLPGYEWERVIRSAVVSAYEEIHAHRSGLDLDVFIIGAEHDEEEMAA
ncbi:hypothetical protein [Streptosporangium sp. NPDC002524]|uniref:hypothetical protein n=1 Tax=Streptosporangium sp. NPDC002524 TaxID=3154537 RepID=UPI00331F02FA